MARTVVAILGAGRLGQALAKVLSGKRSVSCRLWDSDTTKVPGQAPLSETIAGSSFVFFCVPSWAMREALQSALPAFEQGARAVVFAKGIEDRTLLTMDALCDAVLSAPVSRALVSGPMLAEELGQELFGRGVVASRDRRIFSELRKLFRGTKLSLEYSRDERGVALAGLLKNVYVLALGIADGLRLGSNAKGMLATQAFRETSGLIAKLGGRRITAFSSAGIGDFIATGFSPHSRNRGSGERLALTGERDPSSEGLHSLSVLSALFTDREVVPPPLFQALLRISGDADPREELTRLLSR